MIPERFLVKQPVFQRIKSSISSLLMLTIVILIFIVDDNNNMKSTQST